MHEQPRDTRPALRSTVPGQLAPLVRQVRRVTRVRASSATSASTDTAYSPACSVLLDVKSRRPPVRPCAIAPNTPPQMAPMTIALSSTAHQAELLNSVNRK